MIGDAGRQRGALPSEVGPAVVGRLMLTGGAGGLVVGAVVGATAIALSGLQVPGLLQIAVIYGGAAGALAGIALALVIALMLRVLDRYRGRDVGVRQRVVMVPPGVVAVGGAFWLVGGPGVSTVERVLVAAAIGLLAAGLARLAAPWCLSPEQAPGR